MSTATVAEIMSAPVHFCVTTDTLDRAARIMWDHDCGVVPIIDRKGNPIGMITDRDICMAAYTKGKPLWRILVTEASALRVWAVRPDDSIATAEQMMDRHRVRRLAVIDRGGNLVGIVSLADILRRSQLQASRSDALDSESVAATLANVFRPHFPERPAAAPTRAE